MGFTAFHAWMASRIFDGLLGPKSKRAYVAANWTPQATSGKDGNIAINSILDQKEF